LSDTLRAQVGDVDVVNVSTHAPSARDYDAVVVAASVHAGGYQSAVRKWVEANADALNQRPTAFVSVCLAVIQQDARVQQQVSATIERFTNACGWRPTVTKPVAGALLYRDYNWIKRWMMKRIVAKSGGDTDTSRNFEYTDWNGVRTFAAAFGAVIRKSIGRVA
jgi:menaquinone-dependent protoporphyrinogen oxidase